MGEVRVAIIGGVQVFPGLLQALQDGVSMFNDNNGTLHQVGLIASSEGVGASTHVPYPHIIVSRARVGNDEDPVSTVGTICRLLEPCRDDYAFRAFILDDIQSKEDRDELRREYYQLGFSEQVRIFAPYTEDSINRFVIAVMVHLNEVLTHFGKVDS